MIFVVWYFLNHITQVITTLCPVKTIYLKIRLQAIFKINYLYHNTTISNVWKIDDFPNDSKSKHIFWPSRICLTKTSKRCSLDVAKIQLPTCTGIESVYPFFLRVYSKLIHVSSSQNKGVISLRYLECKAWLSKLPLPCLRLQRLLWGIFKIFKNSNSKYEIQNLRFIDSLPYVELLISLFSLAFAGLFSKSASILARVRLSIKSLNGLPRSYAMHQWYLTQQPSFR